MMFRRSLGPLLLPFLLAATPDTATYHQAADELFYFLVISDTHIDAPPQSGKEATENLHWATSTLYDTVLPAFIVNGGDLTDATGGGLIPLGPQEMEWESYQAIVDDNGMTAKIYYDLPGNHDHYLDGDLSHYLEFSVQGRQDGLTNHAWTRVVNGTTYLFVAVASAASDGLPFPEDNVGLDGVDLAFLDTVFQAHPDADILTIFSHHPAAYYMEAKAELYDLLKEQNATAFIHGHTHGHSISWQQGTLHIENASLGKSSSDQVGLVAYDGRGISTIAFDAHDWPQVMITAPLDGKLGKSHKYDYMVPDSLATAPVRALAFHPEGIAAVTGSVDGEAQTVTLTKTGDRLWEGTFDATLLDSGPHQLLVSAHSTDGPAATHAITFYVIHDEVPVEPPVESPIEAMPDVMTGPEATDYEVVTPGIDAPPDLMGSDDLPVAGINDLWPVDQDVQPAAPGVSGYIKHSGNDGCTAGPTNSKGFWLLGWLVLALAWLRAAGLRRRLP